MTINMHKHANTDDLWRQLVHKTLDNALFDGLTQESLLSAADALHIPHTIVYGRIQDVKIDIPRIWWDFLDTDLYTYVTTVPENCRIRNKIARLVKHRLLTQMAPYKAVVRDIFAQFALPHNVGFATQHMWDTAHHMWCAIGDTTAPNDRNYYTKRLILCGVIFTSVSYWLQDDSNTETEAYIDRRIADALRLGTLKARNT